LCLNSSIRKVLSRFLLNLNQSDSIDINLLMHNWGYILRLEMCPHRTLESSSWLRVVETAKPKDKTYKMADGGLYLEVSAKGSKYWRMKYRLLTKKRIALLLVFGLVTLAQASKAR
jgi:hypothetical protein